MHVFKKLARDNNSKRPFVTTPIKITLPESNVGIQCIPTLVGLIPMKNTRNHPMSIILSLRMGPGKVLEVKTFWTTCGVIRWLPRSQGDQQLVSYLLPSHGTIKLKLGCTGLLEKKRISHFVSGQPRIFYQSCAFFSMFHIWFARVLTLSHYVGFSALCPTLTSTFTILSANRVHKCSHTNTFSRTQSDPLVQTYECSCTNTLS